MYESYLFTQLMPAALLSYINADLGPDSRYAWIAIAWNLGAAIIVTIGSRLSDIMGRRWFLIVGAVSAAVGAIVGATSQSITQSIVSGILFGLGGGFQEMCFACAQGSRSFFAVYHLILTLLCRARTEQVPISHLGHHDHGQPHLINGHSHRLRLCRVYRT